MPSIIKKLSTKLLKPLAVAINALQIPWQRLWAHACLAAKINTPLDPSVVVHGCPEVHGTGQISFGKNLCLYRELYLETQEQGQISIGDEVVLSRGVHLVSFTSIRIGTGTMIGEYTSLRDANHRVVTNGLNRHAGHTSAPIVIGTNVWIGRGVTVLAGVTIGDNAVIGANAVVTKDIPPNLLAVGIPARPIKPVGN
jgi:acetyltransferase-like isoleucine patch superfamily enzyme